MPLLGASATALGEELRGAGLLLGWLSAVSAGAEGTEREVERPAALVDDAGLAFPTTVELALGLLSASTRRVDEGEPAVEDVPDGWEAIRSGEMALGGVVPDEGGDSSGDDCTGFAPVFIGAAELGFQSGIEGGTVFSEEVNSLAATSLAATSLVDSSAGMSFKTISPSGSINGSPSKGGGVKASRPCGGAGGVGDVLILMLPSSVMSSPCFFLPPPKTRLSTAKSTRALLTAIIWRLR
jgi:hypothetical protein